MKALEEKILQEGTAEKEEILKVDTFIHHQMDPAFMAELGKEFASFFQDAGVTKVATIESSGIAPALMTAAALQVPLVILKKEPSKKLNQDFDQTMITSYTKENSYELTLKKNMVSKDDHVLIIDDFLANGETATGAIRLLHKAGATIAGVGVLIEKTFQPGRIKLEEQGITICSLAKIASLKNNEIQLQSE